MAQGGMFLGTIVFVRTWRLGVWALWLGCVPSGLTLEVTATDPAVQRVELFVAGPCEGACPVSVAAPGLAAKPSDIFVVDDPQPWSATMSGGAAVFDLRADQDEHVSLLVAVGFDATNAGTPRAVAVLHDVRVPASERLHWQMPLSAAAPIDDAPATGERVAVWRQPSSPGLACVMVEHAGGMRELVVPEGDTDCDQIATGECAPWTNLAVNAPSTIGAASCLLPDNGGSATVVCKLGGPTCSETGGSTMPCAPLDTAYCAPSALCNCAPWDEACVRNEIALSFDAMPLIRCEVPLKVDGAPCDGSSELHVPIPSSMLVANTASTCEDAMINDVATPLGAFARSVMLGGATLTMKKSGTPCATELVYSGKVASSQMSSLLVDLALDNRNHLVVPMQLKLIVGGCDDVGPLCSVTVTTDSMFTCARPTTSGSLCGSQGGCGGPMCGNVCCTTGEQCVNGVCMCGPNPGCTSGYECAAGLISPGCGSICCGSMGPGCEF
jgi:hypothetical protein